MTADNEAEQMAALAAQAQRERAKAFEDILRANPPNIQVLPAEETKPKTRDLLYRGNVFTFRPIGPPAGQERRNGVVERWQADSSIDGLAFSLIVREFYDGRFTPWAFDGIFFKDFVQAATVGVVVGILEAQRLKEHWEHERSRRKFLFAVVPSVAFVALVVGFILGVRHA